MVTFDLEKWNTEKQDYLGINVWWTVSRFVRSIDEMNALAVRYGLDPENFIEPSEKKAFSRTAKGVGHSTNKFARTIKDTPNAMVVGIVTEKVDQTREKLRYNQETKASFDKSTKHATVEGKELDCQKFLADFSQFKAHYTDGDLRTFIRRSIQAVGAVSLRPTGGIYFVPRQGADVVAKLDSMLSELGIGRIIYFRVPNKADEKQFTWEAAEVEIRGRISDVLEKVSKIGKRTKCAINQQERLGEVQKLVDAYMELTESEAKAGDIVDVLREAESEVSRKIGELQLARV